jgi:DNA primase
MIINATDIRKAGNDEIIAVLRESGLDLQKRGANYVACCPFHNEKTPSFTVFPQTGTYKCFGCGEGGDSVSFFMENEGQTFVEALEKVASIVRKTVEYDTSKGNIEERRAALRKEQAQKAAQTTQLELVLAEWQKEGLPFQDIEIAGEDKQVYVQIGKRQFPSKMLKEWGICYAPKGNVIYKKAVKEKWPKTLLQEVGIINADGDRFYDFFRDRLIFPIYFRKQLVGFAGRTLPGSKQAAKYVNSKQSLLFDKSEILYGLDEARRAIVKQDECIVVEGYTDVMQMHWHGFKNTVANMGTSFTEQQAQLIKRSTRQVLFIKDGDQAGFESMKRDVLVSLKAGLIPSIVIMPEGVDPDSTLREIPKKVFQEYIKDNRQDGIIWRVMQEYDKDNMSQTNQCHSICCRSITTARFRHMLREAYIKKLTTNLQNWAGWYKEIA